MNVRFENNNTKMIITADDGDHQVDIMYFKEHWHKDQHWTGRYVYNWFVNHPPKKLALYKGQKIGIGGSGTSGTPTTNFEQCLSELKEYLKNKGLPYTQVSSLKPYPRDTPEREQFMNKLQTVVQQFQQDMAKPENQPKPFGKGPPDFGQWLTAEDIKSGRLKWAIDNYGEFWLVIKWSHSPRQRIKSSELLKNYDNIMRGKTANGDYAREIFVAGNPYEDNKKNPLKEGARILVRGINYWLDPKGNFHDVHIEGHVTWARNYLRDHNMTASNKDNAYKLMYNLGFVRIKTMDGTLYYEYGNKKPTNLQLRILKDSAIESGLKLQDDGTRYNEPLLEKKIDEIESPYSKATVNDKKRGYIGVVYNGVIYAYDQPIPNVMETDHSELINGRNGERWRYFIQSPKNTILWNEFPPSKDDQFLVEDWIHKKGHIVDKNISLREYHFITGKNKIFENINNHWKDITVDDLDDALDKAYNNNISLKSLLNTIIEFYYSKDLQQKRWAIEYIGLLNQVAYRVIEIAKRLNIPYFSLNTIRSTLLAQEEFKTKIEEFFPFSIYVAASNDEYDTVGIGIDLNGKILGIEEGNDEATPATIQLVNKLVNPNGKQVRVYGSHDRDLCFKIQETGYLPPNLFISPDKGHAQSYMDLKGERETFTGIINVNDIAQDSDLDWKTISNVKIDKFRFI